MNTKHVFEQCAPEEQYIDGILLEIFRKKLNKEKVLGCLILRNGKIVFEFYKNKKIEPETQHINSCTKSIISALCGICFERNILSDMDIPIVHYFSDLIDTKSDERKALITIRHLLTMSAGFRWPEFGEWHFFAPMRFSKDLLKFILDRDLETDPGSKMNYNSGCSHLLTAIIQKECDTKASEVADEYLFKPLGIEETRWYEIQGINLGADGLKMKLIDMLKFGYLYLNKGLFGKTQIVPEKWIYESIIPRFTSYPDIGSYGYHFWISSIDINESTQITFYFAMGFGGQYIIIVPAYGMVVVFVSRVYQDTLLPMRLFREYIIKAIKLNA